MEAGTSDGGLFKPAPLKRGTGKGPEDSGAGTATAGKKATGKAKPKQTPAPVKRKNNTADDDADYEKSKKPRTTRGNTSATVDAEETKTPKKPRAPAGRKPKAESAPSQPALPSHVSIAADALHSQFRADLDLAMATRRARTEEAQALAWEAIAALSGRCLSYMDLAAFELHQRLQNEGVIAMDSEMPVFKPAVRPSLPELPNPFRSLWLSGGTAKGPLVTVPEEPETDAPMLEGEPLEEADPVEPLEGDPPENGDEEGDVAED
ncbi:hypothetical protein B0H11DRAFT_2229539 [Mycena galericulata]|nr:hypothetical protein B0H11DRAFT_2229539 [Mycena galericulata]